MSVIKLTLFHTKAVRNVADTVFQKQISSGNAMLKPFNIKFEAYPVKSSLEIDYDKVVDANGKTPKGRKQRDEMRMACHAAYQSGEGRLPVILCQISGGGGEAPGSLGFPSDWLPYVILDSSDLNQDGLTMLHEAGHCAGLKHPEYEPRLGGVTTPNYDNVMSYGQYDIATSKYLARTLIENWQIDALKAAYFHYG